MFCTLTTLYFHPIYKYLTISIEEKSSISHSWVTPLTEKKMDGLSWSPPDVQKWSQNTPQGYCWHFCITGDRCRQINPLALKINVWFTKKILKSTPQFRGDKVLVFIWSRHIHVCVISFCCWSSAWPTKQRCTESAWETVCGFQTFISAQHPFCSYLFEMNHVDARVFVLQTLGVPVHPQFCLSISVRQLETVCCVCDVEMFCLKRTHKAAEMMSLLSRFKQ